LLKRKKELDLVIGKLNKSLALQPGFNKYDGYQLLVKG
jgi:hypothetical protein